jgi:hypothetical protein
MGARTRILLAGTISLVLTGFLVAPLVATDAVLPANGSGCTRAAGDEMSCPAFGAESTAEQLLLRSAVAQVASPCPGLTAQMCPGLAGESARKVQTGSCPALERAACPGMRVIEHGGNSSAGWEWIVLTDDIAPLLPETRESARDRSPVIEVLSI